MDESARKAYKVDKAFMGLVPGESRVWAVFCVFCRFVVLAGEVDRDRDHDRRLRDDMSLSICTGLLTRLPISSSPICLIGRATFFIDVKGVVRGVCTKNIDFRRVALLFRFPPFIFEVDARLTSELIFALLSFVLLLGRDRTIYCDLQLQCAY